MSFEIKNDKIEVRIPSLSQSYNHGCEVSIDIVHQWFSVVEDIVIHIHDIYFEIEGEYEIDEDAIPDYIHEHLDNWVNCNPVERLEILNSYGLNRAFKEVVEEYGMDGINQENLEGHLVYHIVYQLMREIPNEFWVGITKAVIQVGYSSDVFEFVDC